MWSIFAGTAIASLSALPRRCVAARSLCCRRTNMPGMLDQLAMDYPDVYCLTDGEQAEDPVDLPISSDPAP